MALQKFRKGNVIGIVMLVAAVTSLGVFAYLQLSTTSAYVATKSIEPGTKITSEMLSDGTLKLTQVPRSMLSKELTQDYLIKDFNSVDNQFVKYGLKPGKLVFLYDIASSKDTKNNEVLKSQNLEAVSINLDENLGSQAVLNIGDKVNLYGIYTYDVQGLPGFNGTGVPVSALSAEMKDIAIKNGYTAEQVIKGQQVTFSKLLYQNVPIVDVVKEKDTDKITKVSVGADAPMAELMYLTMRTGKIGMSLLPYNENGDYNTKPTKGSMSYTELINKGTINDVKVNNNNTSK